jgi:MFS family permease
VGLGAVGVMTAALVLVHTACNVPAGRIGDRVGPRRMILAGLLVIVLTNAVALIAPDLWLAIAARAVMGVGAATTFVASSDYVRGVSRASPLGQGFVGGAALGGAGLALALVPLLDGALGWRTPYVTGLLAAILAAVVFEVGWRASPGGTLRVPLHAHAGESRTLARDSRLYSIGALHMASMGLAVVLGNWIVTLLVLEGGESQALAGAIGSLILLLGVCSRPLGGWIARRHPERTRRALQASLIGGGIGAAVLATVPSPPLAAAAAAFAGICAGIPFGPAIHAAATTRPDAPGEAVGFVNMLGNLSALVGTPLLGLALSFPDGGTIGFAVVAVLWAGAALLVPSERSLGLERAEAPGGMAAEKAAG